MARQNLSLYRLDRNKFRCMRIGSPVVAVQLNFAIPAGMTHCLISFLVNMGMAEAGLEPYNIPRLS